jgi:hypothetical protein
VSNVVNIQVYRASALRLPVAAAPGQLSMPLLDAAPG